MIRTLPEKVYRYRPRYGFDARYMKVGHSGWKAVGAPVKMTA